MIEFFKAVCDEHKQMCDVFQHNTFVLIEPSENKEIVQWLQNHYECSLRLIHRDDELDHCYSNEYIDILKPIVGKEIQIAKTVEESIITIRTCNRHDNCEEADQKAKEKGRFGAEHCHDECCEECFGY